MTPSTISVRGAAEHNLDDVDLDLPHGSLIAISGVSGSGKSSLAFDTIYSEARRRYLMTLDRRGQALVRRLRAPAVRSIEGLAPAVAIGQVLRQDNPRSTVATLAGIHSYLRLLFARLGSPLCMACGAEVRSQRFEEVYETVAGLPEARSCWSWRRGGWKRVRAGPPSWTGLKGAAIAVCAWMAEFCSSRRSPGPPSAAALSRWWSIAWWQGPITAAG